MKRATMVFFDEAGFSSDELITIAEAFATQNSDFKTSTDSNFNVKTLRKSCPTQLVYASSASHIDTTFFRHYKNFAKRMFMGDINYFCCDIPCDVPLNPYMDGEPHPPLLKKITVDNMMKVNREKAMREYYNKFANDGGEEQIVKWGMIRRNENFVLPILHYEEGSKYIFAFDPARINDNSILTVMELINDENIGYYGKIVNCINLVDIASKRGLKLTSVNQLEIIREYILSYNGNAPDYENIVKFLIDPGAGGGGVDAYGDNLLLDWTDKKGNPHRGMIDNNYEIYDGYKYKFPNAVDLLGFLPPKKLRTKMVEEFLELLKLDLIKFPKEYSGANIVNIQTVDKNTDEIIIKQKTLTLEEHLSLINIDILKTECTSIHKIQNAEGTNISYALPKEKENKMHDDRFYTMIMLSHFLYELRRGSITKKKTNDIGLRNLKYRKAKPYGSRR